LDFTGGALLEVNYASGRPDKSAIESVLSSVDMHASVRPSGETGYILRLRELSQSEHTALVSALSFGGKSLATEVRFDSVGPLLGKEALGKSLLAIALIILCIVLFITFAFRKVSLPVSSWKYGVITVVALLHDLIVPAGVFAYLGHFNGVEVDTLFVTALLVVLGFSVHDTIVVFDRIRENLHTPKAVGRFAEVVNASVNQTFGRSLNTSLTVILALSAVYFFGGESTQVLSLALIIGILIGTYSSIFIASPLLVSWNQFEERRRKRISPK
jgi:preprotein translocase subunit SecF